MLRWQSPSTSIKTLKSTFWPTAWNLLETSVIFTKNSLDNLSSSVIIQEFNQPTPNKENYHVQDSNAATRKVRVRVQLHQAGREGQPHHAERATRAGFRAE